MTFPAVPLDLGCDLLLGDSWTDVSGYVYQRNGPVMLERGRADESSEVNPAEATWEWNNRDGRFSPKNPLSPYYGLLQRNTPARFSIPAQVSYMRLEDDTASYASCPSASALQITGDTDIRIDMKPSDYSFAALCSRSDPSGTHAWLLDRLGDGTLLFYWWDSGATVHSVTSQLPVPYGRAALRVTLAVATGTVTFWTAATIAGPWTQLGAAASGTSGASTSVYAATAPVRVGDESVASYGAYYGFQLLNGIGGTIVAYADFTSQTAGATSWADSYSNTWTLSGTAEISGRNYRGHFEMSSQPPKWDVTGTDMAVEATAGGPLRRMSQGSAPPVQSPIKRAILGLSGTLAAVAYWPCEDAAGATSLGSGTGGPVMTFDASAGPALGADSGFLCSAPLLQLNGSRLHGVVPSYTSNGSIVVRFLADALNVPGSGSRLLVRLITSGGCRSVELSVYNGGGLGLAGYSSTGASVFNTSGVAFGVTNERLWYSIELTPSGTTLDYAIAVLAPGSSSGSTYTGSVATTAVGNITGIYVNPSAYFTTTVFGHCSVQSQWESLFNLAQPLNAWQGETAGSRFTRLATENGYAARVYGAPDISAAMGAQPVDTLPNLLQECEDADRGQIYEPRQCLGLGYRTLASMLNQAPAVTLDYSQGEPGGAGDDPSDSGLDPTYDDQLTRNDWTVTRGTAAGGDGMTYRAELNDGSAMSVTGTGDYADTLTVYVQYDTQVPDIASWLVHTGTVDEARWPVIPVNLARSAIISGSLYYPAADTDIGDLIELGNVPGLVTYDTVKQLAWGTTEQLGGFTHTIAWNAVPGSPYETGIYDDPVYGRADTAGSALCSAVSSSATSLLAASAGLPWTASAADLPFDAGAAGERVTVTAVAAGASGTVTSPGTFAYLATCALPAGTWTIGWTVTLSGTTGSGDAGNFLLTAEGWAGGSALATSVNAGASGTYVQATATVTVPAGVTAATVNIKAGGTAPTTGAVYGGVITSPQALTVTRAVNGVSKAQAAGTGLRLWTPPVYSLT